jgi:UDP-glucose 4-epimerase
VRDTIRALKGLVEADGVSGEVFNVGGTDRISIGGLAERVIELTGSSSELSYVPYDEVYGLGIEDTLHREPAIDKIGAAIGWRPEKDLGVILDDVIAQARLPSQA